MATIFGALGLNDTDRVFNATVGQRAIYDLAAAYVQQWSQDVAAASAVFVEQQTSDHTLRYKLPGSGYLQRSGESAMSAAKRAYGSWDVSFPLEDFRDAIASDDVTMAYMTAQELQRHIDSVLAADANTRRFEILKRLFNNNATTFVDPLWGSLTIQPLANNDSVTYPPILGAITDATEMHYLESGYAASAISDTNNPYVTIADELEEHFGAPTGGSPIAVFINNAQTLKTQALTNFIPITAMGIIPGTQTATVTAIPSELTSPLASWRILGREEGAGAWVVEWRFIPSGWALGIHLGAPKPLFERLDPADTGLGSGLQLVAKDIDFPFETSVWRDRFGFGAGNRLNGVAFEFGTGGSYTVPTAFA